MDKIRSELRQIENTAMEASLIYVVCFFYSPVSNSINRRVGYFESNIEAEFFRDMLRDTYEKKHNLPYCIRSSVDSLNCESSDFFQVIPEVLL